MPTWNTELPEEQKLPVARGAPRPAVYSQGNLDFIARSASTVGLWKEQSNPPNLTSPDLLAAGEQSAALDTGAGTEHTTFVDDALPLASESIPSSLSRFAYRSM